MFVALLLIIYALISYFLGKGEAGWTSIMAAIAFLGGVQLLSIGVLGEYVARIYDESKGRPLYVVAKEINIDK